MDKLRISFRSKAIDAGFNTAGIVNLDHIHTLPASPHIDSSMFTALKEHCNTALVVTLPYPAPASPGDPSIGVIAPFAQQDHYREAADRLKTIISTEYGFNKKEFRIFVNSRFPEKALAVQARLGRIGRNSLLITESAGSLCVIAGAFLPIQISGNTPLPDALPPGKGCGACHRCLQSCPTHAIGAGGTIDSTRCIQALATQEIKISAAIMETWGNRIYGCQVCQEVCPYNNKDFHRPARITRGRVPGTPPGSISLETLLDPEQDIKSMFARTALSPAWISGAALRRNALIAAGNSKRSRFKRYIHPYMQDPREFIRYTAKWALARLGRA